MIKRIFLYILLLGSLSGRAQTIDSMINLYGEKFPQEKIYVHFDKSYYNAGETIWFKAYILSGTALSDISRNLYTELIDDAGNILERKVAPLLGSSAAASFDIPATYVRQAIHFRAYTTWMLNFDTAFLYEKTFRIVSAAPVKTTGAKQQAGKQTAVTTVAANSASGVTLRFFPEGGNLVMGTESLLAFKATDPSGKPVKVKGTIVNKSSVKMADFTTVHNGMGTLPFTPSKGESYTARWKDATGKEQMTPVPAARENGIVMHLVSNEGVTKFTLRKGATDSGQAKRFLLIAHMNQQIVYAAKVNFPAATSVVNGSIRTDSMPSGVLQVTLFDEAERPLQERIVFINNNEYLFDAYVNAPEKKLTKRGRNVLQIEVPDTMQANLSISVTDAGVHVPDENEDNIYSRFLLSSELRGYIYNAGYYFSSPADSVRRQLDLVMLTNGWRRFNWEDMAQGKLPALKYLPENYISMTGKIIGTRLPLGTQLNLFVQLKDSTKKFLPGIPVEKDGTFSLNGLIFYDTASIFYQFNNDKTLADRVAIHLDNGLLKTPPPLYTAARSPMIFLQDSIVAKNKQIAAKYVELEGDKAKKVKLLDVVTVKAKQKSKLQQMDEKYTSGMFSGGDATSFDLTNDVSAMGAMNIFSYLQGRVAGLQITTGPQGTTMSWRGGTPGVYLNEMPVDVQTLSNISMNDIAYVKVLQPGSGIGIGGGGGGTIAVYTKRGEAAAPDPNFKGLSKMNLPGYSSAKEFYSPDYASTDTPRDLDDIRVTLYWNPYILTDKNKRKINVSFYNNDITKKFRVVIEGVNQAGKLTRYAEIIE